MLTEASGLGGPLQHIARWAVPASAVLMPAGFFLSSTGDNRTEPNRLLPLIYIGAGTLAAGLGTIGIGLLANARHSGR